ARYASAKAGPHLCSTASPSTAGDDSGLKDELEPELDLPGPVRAAGADSALYHLPERRAVQIVRELAAVGAAAAGHPVAIEHVEGLGAELEALALGDSEQLADRHVRHGKRLRPDVAGAQRRATRRSEIRKLEEVDGAERAAGNVDAVRLQRDGAVIRHLGYARANALDYRRSPIGVNGRVAVVECIARHVPGRAAAVLQDDGVLPSAEQGVHEPVGAAQEAL